MPSEESGQFQTYSPGESNKARKKCPDAQFSKLSHKNIQKFSHQSLNKVGVKLEPTSYATAKHSIFRNWAEDYMLTKESPSWSNIAQFSSFFPAKTPRKNI